MTEPRGQLSDLLLGQEPALRVRTTQTGLAVLLMVVSVGFMFYAGWVDHGGLRPVMLVWSVISLGGLVAAFLAIRTGWSLRFADPSLTLPQIVFSIASSAWGYGLGGEMRAIALPMLMIVMMFGMFQLQARATLGLGAYALLAFGLSMGLMAWRRPEVYRPAVELGHFMMLMLTLPAVSVLAGRLSRIRRRLVDQKADLTQALTLIQAMATRDDLTGLLNRRHMQTVLEQETQRSLRSGRGYCLALLDIDHFKRINDTHGHGAGDAALQAFAEAAQQAIRTADVLARWGGEEFVVMLAETRMPAALAGMERLREKVAALEIPLNEEGQVLHITVSAGLTEHRTGDSLNDTLERADKLLYEAKAQGRNRVIGA
ncbi:diguanylate cyclase [Pelomonas sp. KK5]|uniref:diguanylate cyclase n=1 Tax=Pelomonas sp. KK5 TaxID=1855730 RepID=UPI00097C3C18|nr:diguanylate cyclase [Pelomonas sp. KK5]